MYLTICLEDVSSRPPAAVQRSCTQREQHYLCQSFVNLPLALM